MDSVAENTIVFPVVRSDLVAYALGSFKEYCGHDLHRVVVIDQTVDGLPDFVRHGLAHMQIRVYRNLGFAKAMNLGFQIADTDFVTCSNDDVEWFDARYWEGIKDAFKALPTAVGINPQCPRIPWGLEKDHPLYRTGIGNINSREQIRAGAGPTWKEYSGVSYTLNSTYVWSHLRKETPFKGAIKGCAQWCMTFSVGRLVDAGLMPHRYGPLYDERFYPGGGEDYDLLRRAVLADMGVYATDKAWVWHDWGQSKDKKDHDGMLKVAERRSWNQIGTLWPDGWSQSAAQGGDRIEGIHREPL